MKDELLRAKIKGFPIYYENELKVVLENIETLLRHPDGSKCKCYILHELSKTYVNTQINLCLLKVYEITEMINRVEPGYTKDLPIEISYLRFIRNKFVAHLEEETLKEDLVRMKEELEKSDFAIIDKIRRGSEIVCSKIQSMSGPRVEVKVESNARFLAGDLEILLKEASRKKGHDNRYER